MSRSRPRTSRLLLVVLGLTVAVGVVTFANQYRKSRDAAVAAVPAKGAAPVSAVPADDAGPLVTQAPTAIAAKPATSAISTTPTTPAKFPAATGPTSNPAAANLQSATSLPTVKLSSKPLLDAKAKADAGELIAARDIYNAALIAGKLSPAERKAAKLELSKVNDTLLFTPDPRGRFSDDPFGGTFVVPPGGVLAKIAKRFNVTPELLCRVNGISDPRRLRAHQTIKIVRGPFHAVVDKSDFTLDLYFGAPGGPGSSYVTTLPVGLGKDDSTPTGTWLVEPDRKLPNPTYYSPRGEGVIDADDPKNPLGEFWIGLAGVGGQAVGKQSYGIHGTIEPESIGTMASMGCIRLRNEDVARVYEMLVEGQSTVVVQE